MAWLLFIIGVAPNWLEFKLFNSKLLGGKEEERFKGLLRPSGS